MLVLSRQQGQKIKIGPHIVITLTKIDRKRVRVGIEAPPELLILRDELEVFTEINPPLIPATESQPTRRRKNRVA